MRRRLLVALLASLVSACCCGGAGPDPMTDSNEPTERRELWRGTVSGLEVVLGAELRAWHVGAHPGPELAWVDGRDFVWLGETVEVANARLPVPRYDLAPLEIEPTPPDPIAARAQLGALAITTCPVESGLAYRISDRPWEVLWIVAGRAFRVRPEIAPAAGCAELAVPERDAWLAAHASGATTCLALDEDGDRHAALDCLARGMDGDDLPAEPPPPDGAIPVRARPIPSADRDALIRRIISDPSSMAGYEDRVLAAHYDANDATRLVAVLRPIDAARGRDALVTRIAASCADPARDCTASMLALADLALRWQGQPAPCPRVVELARAVRSRPEPDALATAFTIVRGSFACDTPELRALALEGLGTATSEDVQLPSPDFRSYEVIDNDCRPYLAQGAPAVSGLCRSYPRWAGSWLATHCGPDAIARATEVASGRPRVPFDPREDQVLDGALRVLAACDPTAFEAAIAHMPDTTTAIADIRSRDHIRSAYRANVPNALAATP